MIYLCLFCASSLGNSSHLEGAVLTVVDWGCCCEWMIDVGACFSVARCRTCGKQCVFCGHAVAKVDGAGRLCLKKKKR